MVSYRLKHTPSPGADPWLDTIRAPREGMQGVADVVAADVAERFAREADPWGSPWPPLSPATLALYAERGKSAARKRLRGSRYARVVDGGRRAVVGLRGKVARWFHEGNPANRMFGKARAPRPARRILPLRGGRLEMPRELADEVMRVFKDGVKRAVRGRG